jgi:hypothetical protein
MDQMRMLKIVEQYSRLGELVDEEITVMRVPDWKTVYLEQSDGMGRAIIMNEYKVN